MQRRLSLTEGNSDKFWYIDVADDLVTVRYGRRGSAGTTKTKQYDTAEKALAEAEKQVASKVKKGYTDEEGASTQALTPVAPTEPTPKTAPAPVAEPVVVEPVVVSDAAADDLGLRVTPFELAYDLSREVVVEVDEESFDPRNEAERAARVVIPPEKKDAYLGEVPLVTIEPLFTTLPSAERREWWRNHFEERKAAAKRSDPHIELPHWLNAVLKGGIRDAAVTGWVRAHDALPEALASRPILMALPEEERQRILASLPPLSEPMYTYSPCVWDFTHTGPFIRAALGALSEEEAWRVLDDIPQEAFEERVTALVALLLPTPEARVEFATRHRLRLGMVDAVPWLIATGHHGLDLLKREIASEDRSPNGAMAYARNIATVAHGPGVVPLFLDLLATKAGPVATEWLNSHISQALKARLTLSQAEQLKPTLRTLTIDQLRDLLPDTTGPIRAVVEELLAEATTPNLPTDTTWWVEAATSLPKPPAVSFDLAMLPPLIVDGHRLTPEHITQLFQALSTDTDHPLVAAVRDRADVVSRDGFAVAVFRAWLASGAVAKQSWCLTGAGWLGDSRFVAELAPL
ncbi:WGR domain-containing protein, partial [Arachnia propionica]